MRLFTNLPAREAFAGLHQTLQSFSADFAARAFKAGDAFDMAVTLAKRQDQGNFQKFFNVGVAEFSFLGGQIPRAPGAVAPMHGWLGNAMGFTQQLASQQFSRTVTQQIADRQVAAQDLAARTAAHQQAQGITPQTTAAQDFNQVASGIAQLITPLAQVGVSLATRGQPQQQQQQQQFPQGNFFPPPAAKSNTGLIIGVVAGLGILVAVLVLAGGKKSAPAASAARKRKNKNK